MIEKRVLKNLEGEVVCYVEEDTLTGAVTLAFTKHCTEAQQAAICRQAESLGGTKVSETRMDH